MAAPADFKRFCRENGWDLPEELWKMSQLFPPYREKREWSHDGSCCLVEAEPMTLLFEDLRKIKAAMELGTHNPPGEQHSAIESITIVVSFGLLGYAFLTDSFQFFQMLVIDLFFYPLT